jgi:cytochrome b561
LNRERLLATLGLYTLFIAGPLSGWIFATWGGALIYALWSLIPLTFLSVWPVIRAASANTSTSRRLWLTLGGTFWLLSSYFYVVAMWV